MPLKQSGKLTAKGQTHDERGLRAKKRVAISRPVRICNAGQFIIATVSIPNLLRSQFLIRP